MAETQEERQARNAAIVAADAAKRDAERLSDEIGRLALRSDDELERALAGTFVGLEAVEPEHRDDPERTVRLRALQRLLRLDDAAMAERREAALAAHEAGLNAAIEARDAQRPPMNVQHRGLLAPFVVRRRFKRGELTFEPGDTIDVAEFWWPPRRIEQMIGAPGRPTGFFIPDPDHLADCQRAIALNGGLVPSDDEPEDPEERKRRLARERQARLRAKRRDEGEAA